MIPQVWVIFNGPSSKQWHGYNFKGPVFGCNFAYRDFPVTDLFVADRFTLARIVPEQPAGVYLYTKKTPLELPVGWRHMDMPGIDSGSFALEQAFIRYPNSRIIVIGADGILGHEHNTVYEYSWRKGHQPTETTHKRHRKTVEELFVLYRPNCVFVSEHDDPLLPTIRKEQV